MMLIALRPVLYLAHQYDAGDQLPVNDPGMAEAWLEAGSAKRIDEDAAAETEPAAEDKSSKALPATALSGQPGISDSGAEGDLIGRIPETPERKKSPAKRKKKT